MCCYHPHLWQVVRQRNSTDQWLEKNKMPMSISGRFLNNKHKQCNPSRKWLFWKSRKPYSLYRGGQWPALTIHFHQKLVEGLLLLCVGEAGHGGGALLAHSVNLVNVDDAGGPGAGFFEEAPHTGSTKAWEDQGADRWWKMNYSWASDQSCRLWVMKSQPSVLSCKQSQALSQQRSPWRTLTLLDSQGHK